MRVKRIGYVGMRTDDVEGMTRFLRDVLGLAPAGEETTGTFQSLPTNRFDLVEVYDRAHRDARLIPDDVDFMVSFVVDDLRAAVEEVRAAGLDLIGEPIWAAEAFDDPKYADFGWCFVRAPDGRVYVL